MGANNHVSVVLPSSSHVKSLGSNPPSQEREDEEEGKEIFLLKRNQEKNLPLCILMVNDIPIMFARPGDFVVTILNIACLISSTRASKGKHLSPFGINLASHILSF